MFVDRVKIEAVAGRGGHGCMSFRREKYVQRGGPDGGDGGQGGSVIIIAKDGVNSLAEFAHRHHIRGRNGNNGQGSGMHGANAEDTIIYVPTGTVIIDADNRIVIKDLAEPGDSIVAAKGGGRGRGNTRFKSSTNQAPRQATQGGAGEVKGLILELKVIADVGVIGLPNAGKSTLLSRLSAARPEIADYPFTTKFPNLGQVDIDLDRSFIMADIPGLIEGAADGVGLGHDFLKHIERAGVLVHLVEPMPVDESDPIENYKTIRNELCQYNAALKDRPELVVVSKSELPGAEDVAQQLRDQTGREVMVISAATGAGLPKLINRIDQMITEHRKLLAQEQADAKAELIANATADK